MDQGPTRYRGVEPVTLTDGSVVIRINFRLDGKLRRKALGLRWNRTNCEAAAKMRAEIVRRIQLGTFRWADYWPEDEPAPAAPAAPTMPTFLDIARQYLASCEPLAKSTREGYRKLLNAHAIPWLGNTPVDQITYGMLSELLNQQDFGSPKTRNNTLTVIRGVLELAFLDGHIDRNPSARLRCVKVQRDPPDPFTLDERDRLLAWLDTHRTQWWPYFALAFGSGMRTSELIAATWGAVDWHRGTIRVAEARVRRETKGTKTATVRDVHLSPLAIAALKRQKAATFMRGGLIFLHPATGAQINDDKPARLVLTAAMRALGIRHRPTYNTRHTRATELLAAGCNPMWTARQLGHRADTLFKHYARWIDEAAGDAEAAKADRVAK
jgi:integrase